jgi:Late exocytosis, associated with Golgi transport/Cytosolic domain of 10TM putative phosphate transporter/Calcium-dependent channel, 7TM region, putative phosphate
MPSNLNNYQSVNFYFVCIFVWTRTCAALLVSISTASPTLSPSTVYTESQDWDVFRTSLIVYIPLFVGILVMFCYVRLKYPGVYNIRNTVATLKNPYASTSHGYLSWIWKTMQIEESEMFRTCGMDALCLLKITRMGSYLSLVSIFCSIFLIPVYEVEGVDNSDRFVSSTTTSLPYGSSSFTASVVGAYIIFGSTMFLIMKEFRWFIFQREIFLSTREARNYTIYVSGIPPSYRSDAGLAHFFRRVIANDVVHSTFVAMYIPRLTAVVDRQKALVNTLERLKAIRDLNEGKEPMHFVIAPNSGEILDRIPAIPYYTEQLDQVQGEMEELQQQIANRRRAINLERPKSTSAIQSERKSSFQCQQSEREFVTSESLASGVLMDSTTREQCTSIRTFDEGSSDVIRINEIDNNDESIQTVLLHSRNVGNFEGDNQFIPREIKDMVPVAMTEKTRNEAVVQILDAGFVTFRKLSAVAVALQTVHSTIPFQMDVFEAPSPDQIIWKNVGLSNRVLQTRRIIAVTLTTLLCVFWTVPVTFLVSLTEINVLKETFPFLEDWLIAAPWLEQLLNQISPLLLSFLNSVVVPILLRQLSTVEGVIGLSHQEASLFLKLAAFHVCASVFFSCYFTIKHLIETSIFFTISLFRLFALLHWQVESLQPSQKLINLVIYSDILLKHCRHNLFILCSLY